MGSMEESSGKKISVSPAFVVVVLEKTGGPRADPLFHRGSPGHEQLRGLMEESPWQKINVSRGFVVGMEKTGSGPL